MLSNAADSFKKTRPAGDIIISNFENQKYGH